MKESKFQANLIKELYRRFDGCLVLKNDSGYLQGIPDLSIFYKGRWAFLECKESSSAPVRPNQEFYINWANEVGSFGRFIFPENEEAVLNELQSAFEPSRETCSI